MHDRAIADAQNGLATAEHGSGERSTDTAFYFGHIEILWQSDLLTGIKRLKTPVSLISETLLLLLVGTSQYIQSRGTAYTCHRRSIKALS